MKRLLALLSTTSLALLPAEVFAASHGSLNTLCAPYQATSAIDGCSNAPVGATIPYPSLLLTYSSRAPWSVAGVNYPAGYPAATVLKDPATIPTTAATTGPLAGIKRSGSLIRCDGGYSGSVLDGYDFSLNNGYGIYDATCPQFTVKNSNIRPGTNCAQPILAGATSADLTVIYNTIDGGGGEVATAACSSTSLAEIVNFNGGGTSVLKYNWIKNAYQHYATFQLNGTQDVRFNFIERCGFYQGNHCNGFQIVGGNSLNPIFAYNTYYSPQPDTPVTATGLVSTTLGSTTITIAGGSSGTPADFMPASSNANSLHAGESISGPNIPSGVIVGTPTTTGTGPSSVTTIVVSVAATATSSATDATIANAYPSGIVIPMRYVAQLVSDLNGGTLSNNTIIATGPITLTSNNIYCDATPASGPNTVENTTISGNYMDISGSFGPFYGGAGYCQGNVNGNVYGSPLPNINMVTGSAFTTTP